MYTKRRIGPAQWHIDNTWRMDGQHHPIEVRGTEEQAQQVADGLNAVHGITQAYIHAPLFYTTEERSAWLHDVVDQWVFHNATASLRTSQPFAPTTGVLTTTQEVLVLLAGDWAPDEHQGILAVLESHIEPGPGYTTWRLVKSADGTTYSAERVNRTLPPLTADSAAALAECIGASYTT